MFFSWFLMQVAFLPFGLLIDMWRWDVFSGKVNESQWNSHWWELRWEQIPTNCSARFKDSTNISWSPGHYGTPLSAARFCSRMGMDVLSWRSMNNCHFLSSGRLQFTGHHTDIFTIREAKISIVVSRENLCWKRQPAISLVTESGGSAQTKLSHYLPLQPV
jgi:hypothetical protein